MEACNNMARSIRARAYLLDWINGKIVKNCKNYFFCKFISPRNVYYDTRGSHVSRGIMNFRWKIIKYKTYRNCIVIKFITIVCSLLIFRSINCINYSFYRLYEGIDTIVQCLHF